MGLSDHMAVYVDLDSELLFGRRKTDESRLSSFFTTTKKKALKTYLETLNDLFGKSKLFEKMD